MADLDVKEVVQEFGKAFEDFKKANDEKLERLEKGEAVADLDAKIGKIEEKLDSLEDINQEITKSQSAQEQVNEKLENLKKFPIDETDYWINKMEGYRRDLRENKNL